MVVELTESNISLSLSEDHDNHEMMSPILRSVLTLEWNQVELFLSKADALFVKEVIWLLGTVEEM